MTFCILHGYSVSKSFNILEHLASASFYLKAYVHQSIVLLSE